MTEAKDQGRSAIGGSTTLGTDQSNVTYGVMSEQITKQLQDNPGAEFIVIQRVRQSEEAKVWSSGDPAQTEDLFRHAYTTMAFPGGQNSGGPTSQSETTRSQPAVA